MPHNDVGVTLGLHRKSLHATKVLACRKCGAPGRFLSHESIRKGWPGCYDASLPASHSEPVGDFCPNCGAARPKDDDLGEVNADIPLWLWKCILAFKWLLIRYKRLRTRSNLHGTQIHRP